MDIQCTDRRIGSKKLLIEETKAFVIIEIKI
jgi:hypothetical protein